MPKPSRKFEIAGPILGSPRSHFSKRGFEIENNQAATIMKTVVGSPGTTIPTIPIATHIKPRRVKIVFFAFVKIFLVVDIYSSTQDKSSEMSRATRIDRRTITDTFMLATIHFNLWSLFQNL